MWVVSVGDAFEGIRLYGPFVHDDDAISWAVKNVNDGWSVIGLGEVK